MNRVELVGGLIRDPELKVFDTGGALCRFTVGVKQAYWDPQGGPGGTGGDAVRSTYVSCVLWGEPGEQFADTYRRGDQLYLMGELSQEEVPSTTGKKETKTRVRVWWTRGIRRPNRSSEPEGGGVSNEPPF